MDRLVVKVMICIASSLLMSCVNGKGDNVDAIVVELKPNSETLSPAEIMDVKGWTLIEGDSLTFVRNVNRIQVEASGIYVFDNSVQKSVLRYSLDGHFISRIGNLGEAPGEYQNIYDFAVDEKNKRVLILSQLSHLYIYDLEGSFIESVKLSDSCISSMIVNAKGVLCSTGYSSLLKEGTGYLLHEYNHDFKLIGEWIEYDDMLRPTYSSFIAYPLVSIKDWCYYIDDINLSIRRYDNRENEVSDLMTFDLDNHMPKEVYKDNMNFMAHQRDYNWIKDVIFTESKILVGYIYDGKYSISIVDYDGNISSSGSFRGPLPTGYMASDGYIYSPISTDMYLTFWEKQDLIKPLTEVSDDTNLLIMKWKLRER